jgi:hypothetical protein
LHPLHQLQEQHLAQDQKIQPDPQEFLFLQVLIRRMPEQDHPLHLCLL